MKKRILSIFLLMLVVPFSLFGSGAEVSSGETDIVQRTFNFIIFAGLIYYLLAEPVKALFEARIEDISKKFKDIQDKLESSELELEKAKERVKKAKSISVDILQTVKKEVSDIEDRYARDTQKELQLLHRQSEERMEVEKRKMVRDVVSNTMNKIVDEGDLSSVERSFPEIVANKVKVA